MFAESSLHYKTQRRDVCSVCGLDNALMILLKTFLSNLSCTFSADKPLLHKVWWFHSFAYIWWYAESLVINETVLEFEEFKTRNDAGIWFKGNMTEERHCAHRQFYWTGPGKQRNLLQKTHLQSRCKGKVSNADKTFYNFNLYQ